MKSIIKICIVLIMMCFLGGCGRDAGETGEVKYDDFQAGESITEEEKEAQFLEYIGSTLESLLEETYTAENLSFTVQRTDERYVINVDCESDNPDTEEIRSALENVVSKILPEGTDFTILFSEKQ